MQHTQLIRQLLFSALAICFIGCATPKSSPRSDKLVQKKTNQKIFFYPYEAVWRATQLAQRYPIAVNNMDNGVLETEWVRGPDGFVAAPEIKQPSQGVRYKLIFNLVKGKISGKESVRLSIIKRIEKLRDFFSDPEDLESDGMEEKVLFYRIERELLIEEGLKKSQK